MFVHVVRPGESLFSIANQYGGTGEWIRAVNELEQEQLVPGMSLVIPAGPPSTLRAYKIQEGETIDEIAQKFHVPPRILRAVNGRLDEERSLAGRTIWAPFPIQPPRRIEVNAYMIPTGSMADREIVKDVAENLTYLSVFSCRIFPDGTLSDLPDGNALAESKIGTIAPLLTITNFDGSHFNSEHAQMIMTNETLRKTTITNILNRLREKGYRGINVDFEHLSPQMRNSFNSFIRELSDAVRKEGFTTSLTLGPKMGDDPENVWVGAFDYRTLGEFVDHVTLLTFEWGWVGGQPMAIAPLNMVRKVLSYAATEIPSEKIMMGMSLYGYNWGLPHEEGKRAVGISPKGAVNLAIRNKTHIHFHGESAAPMFTYGAQRNEMRQVWFEDGKSVLAKFHLVHEFGLRGVSYWMLGHPFSQNWTLLNGTFRIRKYQEVGQN